VLPKRTEAKQRYDNGGRKNSTLSTEEMGPCWRESNGRVNGGGSNELGQGKEKGEEWCRTEASWKGSKRSPCTVLRKGQCGGIGVLA